jgi:HK97 family phage portal protein
MDRRTPVSVYSPQAPRKDSLLSQREASRHAEAYGGKEAIDWVYDCIGLFADPAGTAPYALSKPDGTKLVENKSKGTPPDHEVGPADLYRLLKNPNPYMLYDEMMALLVVDLLLVGNAYWMKWQVPESGKPLAMYRLAPSHVKIKPGRYGPDSYEYQPPGARSPLKIKPEDMIHFRRPNPHSAYYGMGVIQGAGRAMDLEIALTDTISSYYENKAAPSLIVQSERRVPRDVFNKLRAQIRARVSGSHRAGELLVLESGLTASTLDTSAADALFSVLATMSRDRIFAKFRVSPMLFGIMDQTTGSNKISDARREFDNYTLRPLFERLSRQITASLTDAWGVEFNIEHRTLLPPEEATKVGGEIAKLPGIKVRELRRQYSQFGIEESTGDPEIDEFVLNMPTPEIDENGQAIDPVTGKVLTSGAGGSPKGDRPLPGEPGRPPKGENTKGFGVAGGKALTFEDIEARLAAVGAGKALSGGDNVRTSVGNKLPDENRPADTFAAARQTDIDSAMTSMAAELRDAAVQLERGLLDTVEGKALKTSDIVKRINQSAAWATFKERVTAILEDGARQAALSGVMHAGKTPEDEVDVDGVVASTVHRPDGLRSIIATVKKRVANKIKDARDRDGERGDYEVAIRSALSDWSDSQVVTIADSEATEAYNEAVLTTLEMSGDDEVYVFDGDEHDEPCVIANGEVWPISYARQNRKEHPRCRRAFLSLADASDAGVL